MSYPTDIVEFRKYIKTLETQELSDLVDQLVEMDSDGDMFAHLDLAMEALIEEQLRIDPTSVQEVIGGTDVPLEFDLMDLDELDFDFVDEELEESVITDAKPV